MPRLLFLVTRVDITCLCSQCTRLTYLDASTGRCTGWWTTQRKDNTTALSTVERRSAPSEPTVKLPEGLLVHGCLASEKGVGVTFCTGFYTSQKMRLATTRAIFQTFLMTRFTSPVGNIGTKRTNVIARWETVSRGKWQPMTKTSGLGGTLSSTQRSAMWGMPKYRYALPQTHAECPRWL